MSAADLHPDLTPARRRELLLEGITLFNEGRFFDSHEAFEEVWRSTTPEPRDLLQGLIQIAAGMFHHVERRKPEVARRVLAKGRARLAPYPSRVLGMEVDRLVRQVERWELWLDACRDDPPPPPRIELVDAGALR